MVIVTFPVFLVNQNAIDNVRPFLPAAQQHRLSIGHVLLILGVGGPFTPADFSSDPILFTFCNQFKAFSLT